jgi:tRNA pseudouridine38-40 synthase
LVGTGRRPPSCVGQVVAAESRTEAGPTAPSQGLFLLVVRYDRDGTRE